MRELLTRLGFQIDGRNLNIYNTTINNITNNANRAADAVSGLFGGLAAFATLRSIAKTADEMQSLEARVGELPQTVMATADAFDVVTSRASAARQSVNAYTNFYIKLQQAGKDFIKTQEEGLQVTDTISKALILGGANVQEQASTLLQFGQAIGSNVLQGDEFRALAESAPQLVDAIGKQLGIARSDLKKYASEGKLTSKAVVEAVKAISTEFDERFKNMPLTISSATTIIGNRWAVFINRLNRESGAVTAIANVFLKTFDVIEKGLADMVQFFGSATNTLKFFGIALTAALAPLASRALLSSLAFIVSPIGLLIASLTLLGLVIEDVYQWLNWGESVTGQFIGGLDGMAVAIGYVTSLRKSFDEFGKSQLIVSLTEKLVAFKDGVIAAFNGGVVTKFIAALIRMKDYLLNIFPVEQIVANIAQIFKGLIGIFFGVMDVISGLFKATLGFFTGDFDLWYEGIKQIFGGLGDVFAGIWDVLKGLAEQYLLALQGFFRIAFDAVKSIIVDSIYGGMVWAAKKGWAFIKSLFGLGLSPDIDFSSPSVKPMQSAIPSVSSATLAGAAAAPNGVPTAAGNSSVVIKIDQTLPPGTSAETAQAARDSVNQAFNALPMDRLARQMGQVGG